MLDTAARAGGAVFVWLLVGLGLASCGSDDGNSGGGSGGKGSILGCAQGDTRSCIGSAQCHGGQICDAKGEWGGCDCGTGPGVDAGAIVATAPGIIGQACKTDADCGATGVTCLTSASTVFGGGPPHGMCTADCSKNLDTDCAALDPNAICLGTSPNPGSPAYCFEVCLTGSGPDKCHGRADVACDDNVTGVSGEGYCSPVCATDADCDTGTKCNFGNGLCVAPAAITGTLTFGAPCDLSDDQCEGFCLPLDPSDPSATAGSCSGLCSFDQATACGASSTDAHQTVGCIIDSTVGGTGGPGDTAYCGTFCDCDADCKASSQCVPLSGGGPMAIGRAGFCAPFTGRTTDRIATCPATP